MVSTRTLLQKRLRIVVYALLGLIAIILAADRIIVWRFNPLNSNPPTSVVLYSAEWCGLCAQIRSCLKVSRVPFEERDVEKSVRASVEWYTLHVRGVPVTLVGSDLVYGFNTNKLTSTLSSAGYPVHCWSDNRPAS